MRRKLHLLKYIYKALGTHRKSGKLLVTELSIFQLFEHAVIRSRYFKLLIFFNSNILYRERFSDIMHSPK